MNRYFYYLDSQDNEGEILNRTKGWLKHAPRYPKEYSLSLFWPRSDVKILLTINICYILIEVTPSVQGILLYLKIRTVLCLHLSNFCMSLPLSFCSTYRIGLQILWDPNQLLSFWLSCKLINCDNHRFFFFFETSVFTLLIGEAKTEMFTYTAL